MDIYMAHRRPVLVVEKAPEIERQAVPRAEGADGDAIEIAIDDLVGTTEMVIHGEDGANQVDVASNPLRRPAPIIDGVEPAKGDEQGAVVDAVVESVQRIQNEERGAGQHAAAKHKRTDKLRVLHFCVAHSLH